MSSSGELAGHIEASAAWARQLVDAAEGFVPEAHEAFPRAVWSEIVRRHGGHLDLRRGYHREGREGGLTLAARWGGDEGYHLAGQLTWPVLSFDHLSLEVTAARSWLRRLFIRDIEVGDVDIDETFIIDAEPVEGLEALLTRAVKRAALRLASVTQGLHFAVEGASFTIPSDARDEAAAEAVAASVELLEAIAASRDRGPGVYR